MAKQVTADTIVSKTMFKTGNSAFALPVGATKAHGDIAARVQKVGSIGWAVLCRAMSPQGVTATQSGWLSAAYGGNGHSRLNVLRYGAAAPYTATAMDGRTKVFRLDANALDKATATATPKANTTLVTPKPKTASKTASKRRTRRKSNKGKGSAPATATASPAAS